MTTQYYTMTHFEFKSAPFDTCPRVLSKIRAQILAVVQNEILQTSTFCGYIFFCLQGTCTIFHFVLLDKIYAVPLTFHSLGQNHVIIYGPNCTAYVLSIVFIITNSITIICLYFVNDSIC